VTDELLLIHGLHCDNFDYLKSIDRLIGQQHINDVSIDDNSNKGHRYIASIIQESVAPIRKAIGFDYLYRTMKQMYGQDEATRLTGEILDYSLGLADATNIPLVYCWSFNATLYVVSGKNFGTLKLTPPQTISEYVAGMCEIVHEFAANIAGALALGSLFFDMAHIALYREKIDLRELRSSKRLRTEICGEFKQLINSCNQLSRNSIESPFTNISVFDRVKLKKFVKDFDWYFPLDQLPIYEPATLEEEEKEGFYTDYIVDYISELQNQYLDVFDRGNESQNGLPYRFPVTTINLNRHKKGNEYRITDNRFLTDICKREIFRYNIFASDSDKFASCCRLISNSEMMELAGQSNSFGAGGSLSIGSDRVVTINTVRIVLETSDFDGFFKLLSERIESAAKVLASHRRLIELLNEDGLQPFIKAGWIDMNRLFSTFGIIGMYETAELLEEAHKSMPTRVIEQLNELAAQIDPKNSQSRISFGVDDKLRIIILKFFNLKVKEMSEKYKFIGNIEQIPGESFAVRLVKADKLIMKDERLSGFQLYSNQTTPLDKDVSIWDRLEADGEVNRLMTGGGISHATIGERINSLQAQKIIRYAVTVGCEHFVLNPFISVCEKGHNIIGKHKSCPECGSKIVDMISRVVGFFVSVFSSGKVRREHDFPNRVITNTSEI
jgi:ribonucleoside-triphosphate reductase